MGSESAGQRSMVSLNPDDLRRLAAAILEGAGSSPGNAAVVAEHLVESDRLGIHSHGVNRVSQYVDELRRGALNGAAEPMVSDEEPPRIAIDGAGGFGQVAARTAMLRVRSAVGERGFGFATVRNVGHTGRLAAYTVPLAADGCVALAFGTGARRFHRLAPTGGREGRLSTNPISWAAPGDPDPVFADMSTTSVPEGRIRIWTAEGLPVPRDVMCDASGRESTSGEDLYTDPPGFLLPLGGLGFGHKGYALALLAEVFSTLLAGDDTGAEDGRGNNLALLAIRGSDDLPVRVGRMVEYMRSAPPIEPSRPVMVPGEPETRHAASARFAIEPTTWADLEALACEHGVDLPVHERTNPAES